MSGTDNRKLSSSPEDAIKEVEKGKVFSFQHVVLTTRSRVWHTALFFSKERLFFVFDTNVIHSACFISANTHSSLSVGKMRHKGV